MASPTTCRGCSRLPLVSRRWVLAACGVAGTAVALTGCQTYGANQDGDRAPDRTGDTGTDTGQSVGSGVTLARVDDIPVGGGTIVGEHQVVVTRPDEQTVRAFSTTCTHAGCDVNEVTDSTINCPCHGSRFRVTDGSVAQGPASSPLSPVDITVRDGEILLP